MSDKPTVIRVFASVPTVEGAGVNLQRAFGNAEADFMDPFLLLDQFRSDDPRDYILGFPWHPHRGLETVSYLLAGKVRHQDSLGNKGVISPGELQWMSAGSGIIHEEMPEQYEGHMHGYQLWINLPAKLKMSEPKYQGIRADEVKRIHRPDGAEVAVISGEFDGMTGPVHDVAAQPEYFDVTLPRGATFAHPIGEGIMAFIFVISGQLTVEGYPQKIDAGYTAVLADGMMTKISAAGDSAQFLFASGRPLREPIAWFGPMVMNTAEEIRTAIREFHQGSFIKNGAVPPNTPPHYS
jgi:redox-sensitive bicupin YhaK (pirin superfamily)